MGSFPAFLAAWGPVDMGFGSGQGVKCYHSEHLYGELWHRGFTVSPDTPLTNFLISCGANVEASGGVAGVWRHANARERGMKRVQVEPHLSVTGACSAEWVPIKPKTDAAFLYALIHVLLHEEPRERLDVDFLYRHTSSPYLVGPHGFYLRDPRPRASRSSPPRSRRARTHVAIEIGPGRRSARRGRARGRDGVREARRAHEALFAQMGGRRSATCPPATIRRIAREYLDAACVGETIEIEGKALPYRPVAVSLGKTVTNGWGGFECCWARTLLAALVGALEVPGGILGTTVRLNRPMSERHESVTRRPRRPDGLSRSTPPTREHWSAQPNIRNAYRTMVPLAADGPWSQALGPTHFSWMFLDDTPDGAAARDAAGAVVRLPHQPGDLVLGHRRARGSRMARFPFVVAFAFTRDETNHFADVLLPDAGDLESLQLIRIGGSKYIEQFWDHEGFALRQPAVAPQGEARDFTDIATALAARTGLTEQYNAAINRGALGVPLKEFSLEENTSHSCETIWDAACKAASAELTERRRGARPRLVEGARPRDRARSRAPPGTSSRRSRSQGLRFEMPYQERLRASAAQLGRRLHENGMHWWDKQLAEYQALPAWKDFPGEWEAALRHGRHARTTPSGCSPRARCSTPGAATSACS